jgi:putative SOS response-associated peptidase YedK
MCGRYTLTDPDPRILRFRFGLGESAEVPEEKPRFNIAPTDTIVGIRNDKEGNREAGLLRWGLIPHFADPDEWDRLLINARAETVEEQPAFRDAFTDGFRCLIPADGFYEWRDSDTGKQPLWITRPDREMFAFAGLFARAKRKDGSKLYSCTIVTTRPGEVVKPIHDRQPVILDREAEEAWLEKGTSAHELRSMLEPTDELEAIEVSDAVNSVREDGPHLLEPPLKLF